MPTVCAVILTYNRKHLLQRCLEAVAGQTRPCDHIIVVDNASTDGTREMLQRDWAERVEIRSCARNRGASGGFNIAMRAGYVNGADRIWVMDDDVLPEADALRQLLEADDLLRKRNVLAPYLVSLARAPNGELTNVPGIDTTVNTLAYQDWPRLLDLRLAPVRRATFVSILLPRATLEQHGFPIADMYIWGEDSEYTLRVTRDQPGYLVGASHVVHDRPIRGKPDIRTESDPVRLKHHYFRVRNSIYTVRRYYRRRSVARQVVRQMRICAQLVLGGEVRRAAIILCGTAAGLVFDPAIETADAAADYSIATPAAEGPVPGWVDAGMQEQHVG